MKTKLMVSLLLTGALVITVLVVGFSRNDGTINQEPFRKQLGSELFLKPDGSKEQRREVVYWPGTRTIKTISVTYADGGLQVSQYRNTGKISLLTEWFPAPNIEQFGTAPDTTHGPVKRMIEFGEDGSTILKASFYRADGTRQAIGRTEGDSLFHLLDYDVDGTTLTKQQVFEKSGIPTFLLVRVGEPITTETRKLPNGNIETTGFAKTGERTMRGVTQASNQFEDIDFYKDDGLHRKFTVFRHYRISVVYYRDDGSIDHYRAFDGNQMTVVQYRPGVTPKIDPDAYVTQPGESLRQYYQEVTEAGSNQTTFKLTKVEEVNEAGKVARRIQYSDAGQPKKVEYLDDKGLTTREVSLRENGTVETVTVYDRPANGPVTTTETKVDESANQHENFDPRLTTALPLVDPRPLVGDPVQYPYYEYGYGW